MELYMIFTTSWMTIPVKPKGKGSFDHVTYSSFNGQLVASRASEIPLSHGEFAVTHVTFTSCSPKKPTQKATEPQKKDQPPIVLRGVHQEQAEATSAIRIVPNSGRPKAGCNAHCRRVNLDLPSLQSPAFW